jgi:glycerophosphoryl diester phosphodiesterase
MPLFTVAHRAGNSPVALREALDAGVDLVEADVHLYRGGLEVRHSYALGRTLLWERGQRPVRRRNLVPSQLVDVLTAAGDDPRLMLDLKGPLIRVAPRVAAMLRELVPDRQLTVCTKQWRMLDAFTRDPHMRLVHSASNRLQLNRLRARVGRSPGFGVSVRLQLLTPEIVAELRRAVDVVMAWPVDIELDLERARQVGANGIISKNLELLRALR